MLEPVPSRKTQLLGSLHSKRRPQDPRRADRDEIPPKAALRLRLVSAELPGGLLRQSLARAVLVSNVCVLAELLSSDNIVVVPVSLGEDALGPSRLLAAGIVGEAADGADGGERDDALDVGAVRLCALQDPRRAADGGADERFGLLEAAVDGRGGVDDGVYALDGFVERALL